MRIWSGSMHLPQRMRRHSQTVWIRSVFRRFWWKWVWETVWQEALAIRSRKASLIWCMRSESGQDLWERSEMPSWQEIMGSTFSGRSPQVFSCRIWKTDSRYQRVIWSVRSSAPYPEMCLRSYRQSAAVFYLPCGNIRLFMRAHWSPEF